MSIDSTDREMRSRERRASHDERSPARRLLLRLACTMLPLVAAGSNLCAQTVTIVTHDGEEYVGSVIAETDDTIVIRNGDGAAISAPRSAVGSIRYDSVDNDAAEGNGSPKYWGIGATFGTPGGINLIVERRFMSRLGLRLSAGHMRFPVGPIFMMGGLQLDAVVGLFTTGRAEHRLVVGAAATVIEESSFNPYGMVYGHLGYNLHWAGFNTLFSLGIAESEGDRFGIWTFQIGFVHRLL